MSDRDQKLSEAFHEEGLTIGGLTLRPMTIATLDVMLRTGNPLAKGEEPEDGTPELTGALSNFIFTHAGNWPEVVRASFDEQRFKEEALIFCGTLTHLDYKKAFDYLREQAEQMEAAQVDPDETKPGKAEAVTNPAS